LGHYLAELATSISFATKKSQIKNPPYFQGPIHQKLSDSDY
jgi:hypothetical protein